MIQEENLIEVGKVLKPHGVKGDMIFFSIMRDLQKLTATTTFSIRWTNCSFFVEEFRFISSKSCCQYWGINTIEAINYNDVLLYLPKELVDQIDDEVF